MSGEAMPAIIKNPTLRIASSQLAALLLVGGASLLLAGLVFAYSAALGGLISTIPTIYFAHKVFQYSGARAMDKVVRNAYLGEAAKLVLTGLGFALVFLLVDDVNAPALFAGFLLVHGAGLAAAIQHARRTV